MQGDVRVIARHLRPDYLVVARPQERWVSGSHDGAPEQLDASFRERDDRQHFPAGIGR